MSTLESDELHEDLERNESLIWTGRPKAGLVFRAADIFLIPFSIMWCSFAVFWTVSAGQLSVPFSLFGVVFVCIGLVFVFGRFIIDLKQRQHTVYGLTEERIIIKSGVFQKKIQSINLKTISDIECTEKNSGVGTITIGPKNAMANMWGNGLSWWPGMKQGTSLDLITDARKVYNEVIRLQNIKHS